MALRPVPALSVVLALLAAGCSGSQVDASAPPLVTATPDDLPEKIEQATLQIFCNPPTPVMIDGKPAGTTPIKGLKVAPGQHDVTFVDEQTGNRTIGVVLEPGEGKVVTSDRPPTSFSPAPEPPKKKKK